MAVCKLPPQKQHKYKKITLFSSTFSLFTCSAVLENSCKGEVRTLVFNVHILQALCCIAAEDMQELHGDKTRTIGCKQGIRGKC